MAEALSRVAALTDDDLGLFADLLNVVTWELEVPGHGVRWHAPVSRLLGEESGPFVLHRAIGGSRPLPVDELGDALVAPIVETVTAGVAWDNFELIQEVEAPDGELHRMLVRAVAVTDPDALPWVSVAVAERLELLVEHSPDGIIVHQAGLIVYANPAAVRLSGLESVRDCVGKPMASFIRREDIGPVVERLSQLREPGDAVKGHEVTLVRPDGTELGVEIVSVRTTWNGEAAFQVI